MAVPIDYYSPQTTTTASSIENDDSTLHPVFKPCTVLSHPEQKQLAAVHMGECQSLIKKSLNGIASGFLPRDISCSGRSRVFIMYDTENRATGIFKTNPPITEIAASILTSPKRERIPATTLIRLPPSSLPPTSFPEADMVEGKILGMFQAYIPGGDIHDYFENQSLNCPSCHTQKFLDDTEYQAQIHRASQRLSTHQIHFMAIRDLLTYNTDRHCLNLRVDPEDNLWGIDHEEIWSTRRGGGKLWAWAFLPQIHQPLGEEVMDYLISFEGDIQTLARFGLRIPPEFQEEYRERIDILQWAANSRLSIPDMTSLIYALYRVKNLPDPHVLPPANAVFNLFESMMEHSFDDDLLLLLTRAVGDKKKLPPFAGRSASFEYIKEEFLQAPHAFLNRALRFRHETTNWVEAFWEMLGN